MSHYKAFYLSLNPEANAFVQWDNGLLYSFLTGDLWQTNDWVGFDIKTVSSLPEIAESAIVVIPARHHKGLEEQVNAELQKINKVVLFLLGDEEADFDVEKIKHKNIKTWIQNAHIGKHDLYYKLGTGYPKHTRNLLKGLKPVKSIDVFFKGQVTHNRRDELVRATKGQDNMIIERTNGFTQGDTPENYYKKLVSAKIAPCPSGAVIPDSFRLFEALECMCIPIADNKTPAGEVMDYWDWLFGEPVPFAQVIDWDRIIPLSEEYLADFDNKRNEITAWWINWKREFTYKVLRQLNDN
jgi:hypothetical protein